MMMLVNECFKDFRLRSFFIEKKLVCRMLVLFFQTSVSGWLSLTIGEGVLKLSLESSEPELLDIDNINDDFAYPVQAAAELAHYVGKKITGIYEYKMEEIEDGSIGIYFECGNEGFSILENESCLFSVDGRYETKQRGLSLSRLDF
ncbi:hypothetical protein [Mixta calida]|uniref:hypothetical protein n=1 Tax=Mixta calida TaxID=665913 RepID=UPI00403B343A